MRDKEALLKDLRNDILEDPYKDKAPLWLAYHIAEVLIDIRDALVTDCKDAMNALIEIRGGQKHED